MDASTILTLVSVVAPILIAIGAYNLAQRKHRKPWLWFINCLLTGIFGLIVIACSKPLDYDEEYDYTEESDTLGLVMLLIALLWFGLTFWYGWSIAESYHDNLMFDAMMQFMR